MTGVVTTRRATWSLLEVSLEGAGPVPFGILLVDPESDELTLRCRKASEYGELAEQDSDILQGLEDDLRMKAREQGATALIASFEDSLSHFLRISDRTAMTFYGNPQRAADRLFDEHVDSEVRPFVTHLPRFALRAAATKFGEEYAGSAEPGEWVRVPEGQRITPEMFVAEVVGRSMEPLIPDGSLCIFRSNVTGSRKGRYLLIEKFDESDVAARYTIKRYASVKRMAQDEGDEGWSHERIRLEPVNPEFEAFDLAPDAFRVVAEFVGVLD